MKLKTTLPSLFLLLALLFMAGQGHAQTAFTYQGQLRDGSTNANGTYSLTFKLFDNASGGTQIGGTLTAPNQSIVNGLFTVALDFGGTAFDGNARWLEITVQAGISAAETLAPRVAVLPAPYALFATKAGSLMNGAVQNPSFFGTTDMTPLTLSANNQPVLRLQPFTNTVNIIGGYSGNVVSNGFVGATIAGGGASVIPEAGDGLPSPNIIGKNYATIGGGARNKVTGLGGTVGGGFANLAGGDTATVVGGERNTASGGDAFVGGGNRNTASGFGSVVAGGYSNVASGSFSFAAGISANAIHNRSFVWSDDDSETSVFSSTADSQFSVRARGGVRIVTDGSGLTIDGAKVSVGVPNFQVYDADGTFVVPANVTRIMVEVWGGGGGGGLSGSSITDPFGNSYPGGGGGGGGGGAYGKQTISVTPGANIAVTVGQGGSAGGGAGGASSLGSVSASGGGGNNNGGNAYITMFLNSTTYHPGNPGNGGDPGASTAPIRINGVQGGGGVATSGAGYNSAVAGGGNGQGGAGGNGGAGGGAGGSFAGSINNGQSPGGGGAGGSFGAPGRIIVWY